MTEPINIPSGAEVALATPAAPAWSPIQPIDFTNQVVIPVVGPTGAQGASGGDIQSYVQTVPSAGWIISHTLGRLPATMTIYDTSGEVVEADVTANSTTITIIFAEPQAGRVEFI